MPLVYTLSDTPRTDTEWTSSDIPPLAYDKGTAPLSTKRRRGARQVSGTRNDAERGNSVELFPNLEINDDEAQHSEPTRKRAYGPVEGSSSRIDPVSGFYRSF